MTQELTDNPAYRAALTYERFIVGSVFRYWTPLLLERASPQPGEQVLDVACGTGVAARVIVPLVGAQGQVTGLDINPNMLSVACKQFSDHCEDIDWREGRAEQLPFPDASFDLVTCQQGLQFFSGKTEAASEMRRVLRPGGRAVIAVWQSLERHPFYQEVFGIVARIFDIPLASIASIFGYGDPLALEQLLKKAGFGQVRVESICQDVHFQQPEHFIELTTRGSAAVVPAFARLDAIMQSELLAQVNRETASTIAEHVDAAGLLTFPMWANIATARI
jgi:ubiquinone/menaquinone biosynthesis C-methylase UbiE